MTDLGRHMSQEDIDALMADRPADSPAMVFKEVPAGAATSVWAATAPELDGVGGQYALDCHLIDPQNTEPGTDMWAKWAQGEELAARLWAVTEDTLGQKFDL
jgi:hypothetical protein